MPTGKRWVTAALTAIVGGLLAWLSNPAVGGEGVSWQALTEPRVVIPGIIAFLTTLYAYLQPSTYEGARSAKENENAG